MIRQKLSPKKEVLAFHRASETNEPTFADVLVATKVIAPNEALQRIYDELVEEGFYPMMPGRKDHEVSA
jgi:hypothetical protein